MPNPLESMMLEGFRQFQTEQFARDTDDAYAQFNANLLRQDGNHYLQQVEQARQESLSAHGRLGAAIDETFLLGGIKKGATTALGVAGAVLGAPGRALPGGIMAAQEGRNFFEGAVEGFMNRREDVNFATVLEGAGMETPWARNTLGLFLDIALDPLNIFMFRRVQTVAGKLASRLGTATGKVPGVTPVIEASSRQIAKAFGQRLSMGPSGATHVSLLQEGARRGGVEGRQATEDLLKFGRQVENTHIQGMEALSKEGLVGVRRQRFEDALAAGKSEAEAMKEADALIKGLTTESKFRKELAWTMHKLVTKHKDALAVAKPFPKTARERDLLGKGIMPTAKKELDPEDLWGERTGLNIDQIREVEAHAAKDKITVAEAIKKLGITDEGRKTALKRANALQYKIAAAVDEVGKEHRVIGVSSFWRFAQSQYGFLGDEMGPAMKHADAIGITGLSELYLHAIYPNPRGGAAVIKGSEALARRLGIPASYSKKDLTDDFIVRNVDPDVLASTVHDLTQKRMAYYSSQMIDEKLLKRLGGTQIKIPAERLNTYYSEAQVRGLHPALISDGRAAGKSLEDVQVDIRAAREAPEEQLGRSPELVDKKRHIKGSDGERIAGVKPLDDRELIEEIYDASPEPGFVEFRTGSPAKGVLQSEWDEVQIGLKGMMDDPESGFGRMVGPDTPETVAQWVRQGDSNWLLPEEIASSLQKFFDPYEMTGFLRLAEIFNSAWKPLVTVAPWNVSFFARNAIGLVEMMLQAGIMPWSLPKYIRRGFQVVKEGNNPWVGDIELNYSDAALRRWQERGGDVNILEEGRGVKPGPSPTMDRNDFLRVSGEHGGLSVGRDVDPVKGASEIRGGWWGPRILRRVKEATVGGKSPDRAKGLERVKQLLAEGETNALWNKNLPLYSRPFATGSTLNQGMDNAARVGVMLWRMEHHGDTVAEAARVSAKFVGNYNELGAWTNQLAAVFPFFRWSRFSIPMHVEGLIRRPYVGSKLGLNIGNAADDELLDTELETLPDWVLEKHHVMMGREEDGRMRILYGLGLPIEDLNKLFSLNPANTFKNALAEITPILRAPVEIALDQSFWTGEPISNKEKPWNFYNRAWEWTSKVPGLRNALQLEQIESSTGRIFYRANPKAMYIFSTLISRPGHEFDKIWRVAKERDVMTGVNFLTGVKFGKFFPESPSKVPFGEELNRNPALRALWTQLKGIPLYPQFNNPELSVQASVAIQAINDHRRLLEYATGVDVEFETAADSYGQLDPDGAGLAMMVRGNGWKAEGRKARTEFKKAYPQLAIAMAELTPAHARLLNDELKAISPFGYSR